MDPADGIPPDELGERRERLAHAFPAGLAGYRRLRRGVHPVPDAVLVPGHGAAGRLHRERCRGAGRLRAGVRGRSCPCRDRFRPNRVVPGIPWSRASDAPARPRARGHGDHGKDRSRPGRLPGHPRLPGADACGGDGLRDPADCAVDRAPDEAQERRRDRADPGERPLVRARPPASAAVHPPRRDRSSGEPARRIRGEPRHARGARAVVRRRALLVRRRERRLPRSDRRSGAPGRMPWRTTSSSTRATSW